MIMRFLTLLGFLAFSTCAFADSMAWEVTGANLFGSLDLNNGNFSALSTFPFVAAGLGVDGSTVYTAEFGGAGLYSVDPTTGSTTLIGKLSGTSYFDLGSTATGLYMLDTTGSLWNINASTGAATRIGSTLVNIGSNSVGLSTGANTLYLAVASSIYTVDTTTGKATLIATSGAADFGALVEVGGSIFGTSTTGAQQIYRFDPTTKISTFVTNYNSNGYSFGLAPMVPEPSSIMLLSLAGLLFGGYALRRKLA